MGFIQHSYAQGEVPTVFGLSPSTASPGDTVDIDGMGFTPTPSVQFDDQFIPVQTIDDIMIIDLIRKWILAEVVPLF